MEVLKNIAAALEIEETELLAKLKLDDKADSKAIAKAFGIHGLFQTKDELETYINKKVSNKMNAIDSLKKQIEEKEKIVLDLQNSKSTLEEKTDKLSAHFLSEFSKTWKGLNLPEIDFKTQINLDEIDMSNISEEALKIAKNLNLTPSTIQPKQIINNNQQTTSLVDGVQTFEVGVMRTK